MGKEKLDFLKKELEDAEVVIVDEMSMISVDHFYDLHKRLRKIFDSEDDFGGRALLMVGDILQLPPVQGRAIYSKPKGSQNAVWQSMKDKDQNPVGDLWKKLNVAVLKTNFRQGEGDPWTELLNRVRIGAQTEDDIKVLKSRKHTLLEKKQYKKALHLFYRNIDVYNHNNNLLNSLPGNFFVIKAKFNIPRASDYTPTVNDHGLIDSTNFSMNLELKVGARVMMIYNVCISDKLVNGQFGTVLDIIADKEGEPEAIIVSFDDPEAGIEQQRQFKSISDRYSDQRGCPIYKESPEFSIGLKGKNQGKTHGAKYKLTQFPLRLAFAATGHKVQGVDIKRGTDVVVHGYERIPNNLMYVMLSRAQALENVFLEDFDPNHIKVDKNALEQDGELDGRSINHFYENMQFRFFVMNIRSLSKHLIDLKHDMYAQKSSHICVVETWIDPETFDDSEFQMPGKSFHHASKAKGKGCGIFSDDSKQCIINEKIVEDKFTAMSIIEDSVQLILLYISSHCPLDDVRQALLQMLRPDMVQIITGDFNFDASEENNLTRQLKTLEFEQLVIGPTHDDGRTIDHCYVQKGLKDKFELTIHSPYYSDHDALLINFKS